MIALVTGAGIKFGYHTILRLLRCGARVLATTWYPRATVTRYAQEGDCPKWKDQLRIFEADFGCATNMFALVKEMRRFLGERGGSEK
jgi:NAD(P)-dependent dehydrogenase (short-subunit alcohol dehydrogenase family)